MLSDEELLERDELLNAGRKPGHCAGGMPAKPMLSSFAPARKPIFPSSWQRPSRVSGVLFPGV
jgi:hypothetical protein